jgi:1,2-diacylglycerol 3-alpha-glucosyltransferase
MRIGLFTDAYAPIISGVSISLDILSKELTKLGHEVFVITNKHENAIIVDNILRLGGYKIPMKGMREYRIGKVTNKKVREVRELNLDIVHCHTEFTMGRLGRRVAKKNNIPLVHTYHTMYEDYVHFISKSLVGPLRLISKTYSKSFANSADEVVFPTIKVKRTFDRYGYKKNSHIIPTGIYLEDFNKDKFKKEDISKLREELKIDPNDFIMLFLGRMSREKSVQDLLCQFSKIKNENVKLLLVGGGPDIKYFRNICKKQNIEDKVIFVGMVSPNDVGLYYQLGDLFVNFSVTETQGLTYYEALASGLPVLVKYDDNLEGLVENGYNGYSFTDNDDFVRLFEKIIDDKILFNQISNNSSKAIQKFSAENYAKNIEKIYKKLLE